jgi:hypothetical protein
MPRTVLTDTQLVELRIRARQEAGTVVDCARLYRIREIRFPRWWAEAVLGRPYPGRANLQWVELVLLDLAHELEPDPPTPVAIQADLDAAKARLIMRAKNPPARGPDPDDATVWAGRRAASFLHSPGWAGKCHIVARLSGPLGGDVAACRRGVLSRPWDSRGVIMIASGTYEQAVSVPAWMRCKRAGCRERWPKNQPEEGPR